MSIKCVCVNIRMQACMRLPVCVSVCLRALVYDSMRVFVYAFIQACEHTCLCSCVRACLCRSVGKEDWVCESLSWWRVWLWGCVQLRLYECRYVWRDGERRGGRGREGEGGMYLCCSWQAKDKQQDFLNTLDNHETIFTRKNQAVISPPYYDVHYIQCVPGGMCQSSGECSLC